jgi:acid phosphatase (class A)
MTVSLRLSFPLRLLLLGLASHLGAQPVAPSSKPETPNPAAAATSLRFLAPDAIDLRALLPAPPANDSPAGLADLETVLQVQADRTPAQVERAQRVAKHSPFTIAGPVLGPWFTAENLPRTAAVFKVVNEQGRPVITAAKLLWNRTRPYDFDPRVQTVVDHPHNTSYPSGHASESAMWMAVLAAAFPEQETALLQRVHETLWGRILGGAHYPSDTQAGKILGEAIGREMLRSPDMQKAIQEIRAEAAPFLKKKAA